MGQLLSTIACDALPFLTPRAALPLLLPAFDAEEAYCQPCDYEECAPARRQREHQLQRQSSGDLAADAVLQDWTDYRAEPAKLFGSAGFSKVGVQRIDLPFRAWELERVAAWLDDEAQSGMDALRPFHRLDIPERLSAWRQRFDSLDLGAYDALAAAAANAAREASLSAAEAAGAAHLGSLSWSILIIEPNRFFPCHKHPNVEIIYCARGAIYENRVLTSALLNKPREDKANLIDSGFPCFFRVHRHVGGTAFDNPRYSVHQTYTLDEGAVLLVLWCGKHANLADPSHLMWDPSRCQNPLCPVACPDKTFEALARNSAGSRSPAEI